jgi:hypothetical protein
VDNGGPPTTWNFEWNGLDAYGRRLQGEQPITVRTCMVYPYVIYLDEGLQARAFAELSATGAIISSRSNGPGFDIELCREWKGKLGGWDEFLRGLGGWTLSAQHVFDTKNKTIYRGDGERSSATDVSRMVDNVVIGNGAYETAANFMTDGAVATQVGLRSAGPGLAIAPDGTVFFNSDQTVWKLTTDGRVHDVIGSYGTQGLRSPLISLPVLALAPDGTLYVFDSGNGTFAHLYKLPPGGTLTAILTIPTPYVVNGMAVGPDGSVYFSDTYNGRIRKLRGDGSVITVAGVDGTTGGHTGDGGPAT